MGGFGGETASAEELWETLTAEVEKLSANRPRGVNFSEDFAVDRVCASLAKLRQKYQSGDLRQQRPRPSLKPPEVKQGGVEELVGLKVELAMEEQRLRIQQAKIQEARQQVAKAEEAREKLQNELAAEEAARRQASEAQAKQWRDAALRTHLCLANLRTKEREVAHLRAALSQPGEAQQAGEVLEEVVKNLQAERDAATHEAAEGKKELERVSAECAAAEAELKGPRHRELETDLGASVASATGVAAEILSAAAEEAASSAQGLSAVAANAFSRPCGLGSSGFGLGAGTREFTVTPVLSGSQQSAPSADPSVQERRSVREELERIAGRVPTSSPVESTMTDLRSGGSSAAPADASRGMRSSVASALTTTTLPSTTGTEQAPRTPPASTILDEAQRVLQKMDMLNLRRGAAAAAMAPTPELSQPGSTVDAQ